MTPYVLIITLVLLTALAVATRARAADNIKTRTAQTIVATWKCQDQRGVARTRARSPWKPHSIGFRRVELHRWQNRWRACTYVLRERARQWNWQAWLPDKWRRVGVCETGLNWQHYNSSYEGAFGFATSSWDAFKPAGYPDHASQASPWQQYQVALAIYRRYGFSGWGCRGA